MKTWGGEEKTLNPPPPPSLSHPTPSEPGSKTKAKAQDKLGK